MPTNDQIENLLAEETNSNYNKTHVYFATHEWIAITLFILVFMLGNVSSNILMSGMQLVLHREHIKFTEWVMIGFFLLCILSIVTKYFLNVSTLAPFGF